ncbi:MAG: hypothetical protein ABIU09_00360 [Pyrinomonadaceae bacterium]
MKLTPVFALAFLSAGAVSSHAQIPNEPSEKTRGRVVVTNSMPAIKPPSPPVPAASATPIVVGTQRNQNNPAPDSTVSANSPSRSAQGKTVSFGFIKSKIAEAKRQMQQRPLATAATSPTSTPEGFASADVVRIAFHDWKTNGLDYVALTKEAFLSTISDKAAVSENGRQLNIRTIRGNGVNTPITLTDETGENHLPLLVQYPVIREGKYIETAYYMSTHPGLVTPEVINAGRYYVHNVIEIARDRLREKGIVIQPKVADIAERLAAVEHVDHMRFRTEFHQNIFNDVYTLFALNEGQTYRYSVSSAGAGGMVQMIPPTYRMVRAWHPNVPLMPDFVEGMRNHVNASQAMLLYMQRTWNDLIASPTVADAFASGIATQEQLMAAGYNSNPARLAGYINRGGENWTNLIPRETKIYLQIYDSIEKYVPMTPRSR